MNWFIVKFSARLLTGRDVLVRESEREKEDQSFRRFSMKDGKYL